MIPDPYKKTLRLPVRLKDGEWNLFYGGPLPRIKNGSIADLVIETHCLEDPQELAELDLHQSVTLVEEGARLMARMSLDLCESEEGLEEIQTDPPLGFPVAFAPIDLKGALVLSMVAGKPGRLDDCPCFLPALKIEARSVNHAQTLASRHYETKRRSNGGNVFSRVFYKDGGIWRPLSALRSIHEALFEIELAQRRGLLMP